MKAKLAYLGVGLLVPSFWQLIRDWSDGKPIGGSIYLLLLFIGLALLGLSKWRLLVPIVNGLAVALTISYLNSIPGNERPPLIIAISMLVVAIIWNLLRLWNALWAIGIYASFEPEWEDSISKQSKTGEKAKGRIKYWLFGLVPILTSVMMWKSDRLLLTMILLLIPSVLPAIWRIWRLGATDWKEALRCALMD